MPPSALQAAKLWLVGHIGLAKDALHIYVALIVVIAVLAVFRWRLGSAKPLLLVLLVALAGEAWDIRDSLTHHMPLDFGANWHDIWNTLFWPIVLTGLARWTPLLRR